MNEKAFDYDFKNRAKNYNPKMSKIVLNRIDETLLTLPVSEVINEKVKKKDTLATRVKKQVVAAAVALAVITGIVVPSYAKGLPLIGSVLKYFNIGKGYGNIVDEFGVAQDSNGVKLTINSAIYDGYQLLVDYTVESNKTLKEKPSFNTNALLTVAINNKLSSKINKSAVSFSNEYGEFIDNENRIYSGAASYRITSDSLNPEEKSKSIKEQVIDMHQIDGSNIPDKYSLELKVDKLGEVQGNWNFDLVIESEKAKGTIKEFAVNKDLSKMFPNTKLEKVIITPIRVYLQGTVSSNNLFFGYIAINDKNEILKNVGGGEVIQYENYGRYIDAFDNVDKDTKAITLIPYNYFQGKKDIGTPLKVNGVTKISLGSNKELIITKVKESGGKTYIYYKSQYPVNEYLPFHLIDDKGNTYMRNMAESISRGIGEESILVFDELLSGKNIKVVNNTTIYYDEAFTVNIK